MIEMPSERSFGLIFALIFCAIGIFSIACGKSIFSIWLVLSGVLLFCSFAFPKILMPFNRIWFHFGLLLHALWSPITLGILFFGMFTPFGLAMRMLGKRPLSMHFDRQAKSYWIERLPPGPAPETFINQF